MKKIYALALAVAFASASAFGQSQRLVLLEHFSGASCGPCATYNPAVSALLTSNPDKIVSIKYQLAPPGVDPMYSHNTVHSGARASYYTVQGIPNSVLDGNFYNGHPASWNINNVNARYAVPSPFDIDIVYEVTPVSVNATVTVTASQDFTGANLRLHTVVIEKQINFETAPGSNGETSFSHVMKRMLPSQNGTTLQNTWADGESQTFELSWDHANVYQLTELAIVAFVQNNTTKEVHQTAYNGDPTFDSPYSLALQYFDLRNLPIQVCVDQEVGLAPRLNVLNLGTETITTIEMTVDVNGESYPYTWNGNIGLFENTLINIPAINAPLEMDANALEVNVVSINGGSNELTVNALTHAFDGVAVGGQLNINLTFDCWPQETSWQLRNAATNALVASGGNYTAGQAGQSISVPVSLPLDACYSFRLADSYGDGMNGTIWTGCNNDGSLTIVDQLGNTAWSYDGSYQFSEVIADFSGRITLSNKDVANDFGLEVFPNPTAGTANFKFDLPSPENVTYEVYSLVGQMVKKQNLGMLPAGNLLVTSDLNHVAPGIYLVNFRFGDNVVSKRIVVSE